jgi:hypothetical protein
MKYEVIERMGDWIVREDGVEVGRYDFQTRALDEVARRLRQAPSGVSAALSMRYQQPAS